MSKLGFFVEKNKYDYIKNSMTLDKKNETAVFFAIKGFVSL